MKAFRIALSHYGDISGEGAKIYGGRWNLPSTPAIYAGTSISACLLERLTIDPELLSSERHIRYSIQEIVVPEELLFVPNLDNLPKDWNRIPASKSAQEYGTSLLKSGIACFAVPSVVDPSSLNYVINPLFDQIHLLQFKSYPLALDARLVK